MQFVQGPHADHDLRMASGDNLHGAVVVEIPNVESECPHNPIALASRQGLLERRLRLRHDNLIVRASPDDLHRQDARPDLLDDRARRQCVFDSPYIVRCDCRMTARRNLGRGREEADPDMVICTPWFTDECRLRIVQFPRDRLHLVISEPVGVRNDSRGVAGEPLGREGVHLVESVLHHRPEYVGRPFQLDTLTWMRRLPLRVSRICSGPRSTHCAPTVRLHKRATSAAIRSFSRDLLQAWLRTPYGRATEAAHCRWLHNLPPKEVRESQDPNQAFP